MAIAERTRAVPATMRAGVIRELHQSHRRILWAPMGNWQDFLDVTRAVFEGKLIPQVHAVYPIERVAEAEDVFDQRQHFGKIVVQVADL